MKLTDNYHCSASSLNKINKMFLILVLLVVTCFVLIGKIIQCNTDKYLTNRTLLWEDNFEYVDTGIWDYEVGSVRNNEVQEYTTSDDNIFCQNGVLHLRAIKDTENKWTSGSIISRNGFSFRVVDSDEK